MESDAPALETAPATNAKGPKRLRNKKLSPAKVAAYQEKQENTGVLYLGRVPPYLKPMALRQMLSGYGTEVLRIYLQPEDTAIRSRRVRSGGNKKKCFTEGWVEFADKKKALRLANTLNNTPMGEAGKHRSFYAHDLWNLKYLHKFKWAHLTEKISERSRERRDKMRVELAQASRTLADTQLRPRGAIPSLAPAASSRRPRRRRAST